MWRSTGTPQTWSSQSKHSITQSKMWKNCQPQPNTRSYSLWYNTINVLFEFSAPLGEWCITVCSWLSNSVSAPASDKRKPASCGERRSATQSDTDLCARSRLPSRVSSDYSKSSVTQSNSSLKCCQKQDVFLFEQDIKVGSVLKRLPASPDSTATNLKSGVLNNLHFSSVLSNGPNWNTCKLWVFLVASGRRKGILLVSGGFSYSQGPQLHPLSCISCIGFGKKRK